MTRILIEVFIVLVYLAASFVLAYGALKSATKVHTLLIHGLFRWPMEKFETTPKGRILNRISKDVHTVDTSLPMHFRVVISTTFAVISS